MITLSVISSLNQSAQAPWCASSSPQRAASPALSKSRTERLIEMVIASPWARQRTDCAIIKRNQNHLRGADPQPVIAQR